MSDTKALYDVVGKALANWGNGEAQDALEALMGRLRAAEADNAALLELVKDVPGFLNNVALAARRQGVGMDFTPSQALLDACSKPHPGAALLAELEGLEGLRTENERLRQERNHWEGRAALTASEVAQQVVREPIAIRVEGIPEPMRAIIERDAHNAALEEAAKVVQKFSAECSKVAEGFKTDEVRAKWFMAADIVHDVGSEVLALKKTGQGE